jgi:L-asparaginase
LKPWVRGASYILLFILIIHFILLCGLSPGGERVYPRKTQGGSEEKDLKTKQITGPKYRARDWVEPMAIKVFVTGGTFDKEYDMIEGKLFFRDTHLPEMLKLGHCKVDLDIRTLMMIDSITMKDQDRSIIVENCKNCEEERIVITHGTDTMVETAKKLGEAIKDKTIVLTGAMIPYRFGSSDGLFNLGSALAFVQSLPHGVYVAMNGKYFTYDNVMKNKQLGEFEELKVLQ